MANTQPPPLLSPTEVYTPPDVPPEAPTEMSAYENTINMRYSPSGTYTAEDFQSMLPDFPRGRAISNQMAGVGISANIDAAREDNKAEEQGAAEQQKSEEYSYPTSPFSPSHPELAPMYNFEPDPSTNPPTRGSIPPNPEFAALRGGYVPDVTVTKKIGEGTANLIDQDYQVSQQFLDFVRNLPIRVEQSGFRGTAASGSLEHPINIMTPLFEGQGQPNLAQARTSFHEALHAWDMKQGIVANSPVFRANAVAAGLNPVTFEDMVPGREYFAGLVPGDWAHVYNLPANYPGDFMQAVPLSLRKYYEDIYDPNKKTDTQVSLLEKQRMELREGQQAYEMEKKGIKPPPIERVSEKPRTPALVAPAAVLGNR